jgi:hypothetical protein
MFAYGKATGGDAGIPEDLGDRGVRAIVVGGHDQMILGRDVLNLLCVKFDGRRQQFSFEDDC